MDTLTCWQCGQPADGLFCAGCNALQKPPADYYRFFDIPETLSIDTAALQSRFYELSRRLHPDRYGRKAATERQYSEEATSILNDAWRTLRDPIKRAGYVLSRNGLDLAEQRSKNVPPELLEEVFELNMALEELRTGDESARPQLEDARRKFRGMLEESGAQLETAFAEHDRNPGRPALEAIRGILNRRRYIQNLTDEVEKELTGSALSN